MVKAQLNRGHQHYSSSLVVNPQITDLALISDINELVKQYNFTKMEIKNFKLHKELKYGWLWYTYMPYISLYGLTYFWPQEIVSIGNGFHSPCRERRHLFVSYWRLSPKLHAIIWDDDIWPLDSAQKSIIPYNELHFSCNCLLPRVGV